MSYSKLSDRIGNYYNSTDYKILNKLPLIITVNGRGFSKLTSLLDKPFCPKLSECMTSTMLKMCSEIEGTLFAYSFNDEIVVVTRNDQHQDTSPWYDNKLQKICSVSSAMATQHFNNVGSNLNLLGDGLFISHIFPVPNLAEAINTFVFKQQQNFYLSIQSACLYELLKSHNKNTIKEMLNDLNVDEKIELLRQECNVNFNDYPIAFRRGIAAYKVPKVINDVMKNKWIINSDLPIFTKDQSFLGNIFRNGADIFRTDSF